MEKDIYKTLAPAKAAEDIQPIDIKWHPVHYITVMMCAAWAQESTWVLGFVEK